MEINSYHQLLTDPKVKSSLVAVVYQNEASFYTARHCPQLSCLKPILEFAHSTPPSPCHVGLAPAGSPG